MDIQKQQTDDLNAVVTISITPADYQPKVEDALKKVQKRASMPGFRPGKVPAGMIRKMYGTSVLVDEINRLLNDSIYQYIADNKIEILGNPLPKTKEQEIDWENQKDFSFQYDLGLSPQFEVEVDDSTSFNYEVVQVDDALIEKYLKDVRRNYGKPSNPEIAEEKDVLFVDINELDGEGNVVAGGVFKSTSIGIERLKNESVKKKLIGVNKDAEITVHVKDLYETAVDVGIGLGIDKDHAEQLDCNLRLTVKNIARMEDAELNQELFDRIYGEGKIASEEEFRNKIKEELSLMFVQDQDRKLFQQIEKSLIEKYSLRLPDDFLKRWLVAVNEKPVTMEQVEAEFEEYSKAMKWKLIENKIIKKFELTVSNEEAKEEASRFIRDQYARYGQVAQEAEVEKIAVSLLSKEKEAQNIYDSLYNNKIMQLFKNKFKLVNMDVSYNEFFGIKD